MKLVQDIMHTRFSTPLHNYISSPPSGPSSPVYPKMNLHDNDDVPEETLPTTQQMQYPTIENPWILHLEKLSRDDPVWKAGVNKGHILHRISNGMFANEWPVRIAHKWYHPYALLHTISATNEPASLTCHSADMTKTFRFTVDNESMIPESIQVTFL